MHIFSCTHANQHVHVRCAGDLPSVLEEITSGADVNELVDMVNTRGDKLSGVSLSVGIAEASDAGMTCRLRSHTRARSRGKDALVGIHGLKALSLGGFFSLAKTILIRSDSRGLFGHS